MTSREPQPAHLYTAAEEGCRLKDPCSSNIFLVYELQKQDQENKGKSSDHELGAELALCPLRTYICFSSGTAGSTLSPRIPQNSGLPCLMGLKPPPGARSWRRRSREGEGDDCRFSLPLNWAVGDRERERERRRLQGAQPEELLCGVVR